MQSGDGTYKVESRYPDGRVVGKYGYFDPQGVLREASYGAEAGRGFEPVIAGVELPPPTIVNEVEPELAEKVIKARVGDIKIVNEWQKSSSQEEGEGFSSSSTVSSS